MLAATTIWRCAAGCHIHLALTDAGEPSTAAIHAHYVGSHHATVAIYDSEDDEVDDE